MIHSSRLGRDIPETLDENMTHLWLHADDPAARATAAAALDELPSPVLASLLARVSSSERTCSPELLEEVQRTFGTEVRRSYEASASDLVNICEVQQLLKEISRDELLESAANLFLEGTPDEAFDVLRVMGRLDQREIAEFVRINGAAGGTALGAAQWLAVQFASCRLIGQPAERF